jgi:hypothetical protein
MRCFGLWGIIIATFFYETTLLAQGWGIVSPEILEMKTFAEEPEAEAVILFDIGKLEIRWVDYLMERYTRIKIFSESGKEKYSNIFIPFYRGEKISSLKAQTILPNGQIVKLDNDNIFEEYIGPYKRKVFPMPAVEVGAVIEYLYQIQSGQIAFLQQWYFQNEVFTKRSTFRCILPMGYQYLAFFRNIQGFDPNPLRSEQIGRGGTELMTELTWKFKNIPSLKKEPYTWNIRDYHTTLNFQIVEIDRGGAPYKFAKEWSDISKIISDFFKDNFKEDNGLRDAARQITFTSTSDLEKARAIFTYVRDSISTRKTSLYEEKSSKVFKNRWGSRIDKNILLVNLLTHAGLSPEVIGIRTLNDGEFTESLIDINQINHFIVRITIDNKSYYLDTQNKFCPFNLLPPECLVTRGLLIARSEGEIIDLPELKKISMFRVETEARLDSLGNFSCQSKFRIDSYAALEERERIKQKGESDYIDELLKEKFKEVQVESFSIINFEDPEESLIIEAIYLLSNAVDMAGNMIYIDVPMFHFSQRNPFQKPYRNFPVQFPYKRAEQEEFQLILPPKYPLIECPESAVIRNPKMNFGYVCQANGDTLQIQYQYIRQQTTFQPEEYKKLQSFYDEMTKTTQAPAVLKKTGSEL